MDYSLLLTIASVAAVVSAISASIGIFARKPMRDRGHEAEVERQIIAVRRDLSSVEGLSADQRERVVSRVGRVLRSNPDAHEATS